MSRWRSCAASGPCSASCAQSSDSLRHVGAAGVVGEPVEVLRAVARVHADEEVLGGAPVDDHVVDDAAGLAAQAAVLRLAVGHLREVVREDAAQRLERLRAAEDDLAHVRDVEQPDAGPDRLVLREDPGVLHRHLPAGELDQAGAGPDVLFVEWRTLGHGGLRGEGRRILAPDLAEAVAIFARSGGVPERGGGRAAGARARLPGGSRGEEPRTPSKDAARSPRAVARAGGLLRVQPPRAVLEASERDLHGKALDRLQAAPPPAVVRFAVVGDTQLAFDEAADAVEHLNAREDLAFVVQMGDFTHVGIAPRVPPHERGVRPAPRALLRRGRDPRPRGKRRRISTPGCSGQPHLAFTFGRTRFVLFDSNSREVGFDGSVPNLAWLSAQLAPDGALRSGSCSSRTSRPARRTSTRRSSTGTTPSFARAGRSSPSTRTSTGPVRGAGGDAGLDRGQRRSPQLPRRDNLARGDRPRWRGSRSDARSGRPAGGPAERARAALAVLLAAPAAAERRTAAGTCPIS